MPAPARVVQQGERDEVSLSAYDQVLGLLRIRDESDGARGTPISRRMRSANYDRCCRCQAVAEPSTALY
jgi:hypothetical protein